MQIEQHGGLLRSFLDVSLHLTQNLDIRGVLEVIVERAMALTGAPYGAAATVSNGTIDDFVHRGLTPEEVDALPHLPRGHGLLGSVVAGMQVIRVGRLADHPDSIGFPGRHVPMEAFMGVPMMLRNQVLGALFLTKQPGAEPFTDADEEILVAMASMAAVGLSNARLFKAESDRAERSQTLREITSRVRGSLEVDDVLHQTAEQIGRATKADRCFIRLMDSTAGNLEVIGHEWTEDGVEPSGSGGLQFPISTLAALTKETQSVSDVLVDDRLMPRRTTRSLPERARLSPPL